MNVFLAGSDPKHNDLLHDIIRLQWPQAAICIAENSRFIAVEVFQNHYDLALISGSLAFSGNVDRIGGVRSVSDIPVIAFVEEDDDLHVSRLLEAGADAVIKVPVSSLRLVSQIRAILRRVKSDVIDSDREVFVLGDLAIDFYRRQVWIGGAQVLLTPTEYRLLYLLATNVGNTMTHRTLIDRTWGPGTLASADHLKVNFSRLRSKLGAGQHQFAIESIRGVGYRLTGVDVLKHDAGVTSERSQSGQQRL